MSTLRSCLDELRSDDLRFAADEQLVADLDELERASLTIEAERARRLAELERRSVHAFDGHLSAASWLAHRHRLPRSTAAARMRVARALEAMPRTNEALSNGDMSTSAVEELVRARERREDAFGAAEDTLVDAARSLSFVKLRTVLAYWRDAVDPMLAEREEDERFARRHLHVSPTMHGMVRVDGDLDAETGQALIVALRAVQDAWVRGGQDESRTPAQRRADALGEVCRAWLASADRPTIGGERPNVVVHVDLRSLRGAAGHRSELEDVGAITPSTARRIACDATITRVVAAGAPAPLDVGRRTKVVPSPLRRAVAVRDGGCRSPGCERPPGWCDAHHIRHWADGGPTALNNLVLLCRPHHRMIHRGFTVEMLDGVPVFRRPDGSLLEDRAPP